MQHSPPLGVLVPALRLPAATNLRVGLKMLRKILIVEDHPLYAEALDLIICGSMADVRTTHAWHAE